jgi:hypothetical protein
MKNAPNQPVTKIVNSVRYAIFDSLDGLSTTTTRHLDLNGTPPQFKSAQYTSGKDGAATKFESSLPAALELRIGVGAFLRGPMGWAVAAIMIIWTVVK